MYCDFYQMAERPFNVTPDPKCIYLNARYREALASVHYGITQRKGFITLIGEAGTGKTTLLKRLLDQFDEKTKSVLIFNTHVTFEEILEYLFAEFDLPVHNGKKLYMLQRLNTFLLEELRGGGNVALLIDEAQDLDFAVLEDLRLLSNLETAKEKILQIVLSGQPELGEKLSNPSLRQLRQRIAVSCRLLPLSRDEVGEYIQYRLHAAGCPDLKLFSRDAEDEIYRFSRGIPRLINVVCDNALVIGYALGKKRIGGDVITEASTDLMSLQESIAPEVTEPKPAVPVSAQPLGSSASMLRGRAGLIAVVVGAVLVGLLSVGRSMFQQSASSPPAQIAPPPPPPVVDSAAVARVPEVIRPGSYSDVPSERAPAAAPVHEEPPSQPIQPREVAPPAAPPAAPAPLSAVEELAPRRVVAAEIPPVADPVPIAPEPAAVLPRAALNPPPQTAPAPVVVARAAVPAPSAESIWVDPERPVAESEPVAAVVSNERVALTANRYDHVVVQPGDSVSRIALRKYGQASSTILDVLKLANPGLSDINIISVGQTMQLPDLSEGSVLSYDDGRFGVLVFSSTQPPRAAALDTALRQRGQKSRVSVGRLGASRPVYRVVIDGFGDRASAASASDSVQRMFRDDERIAQLVR